MQDNKNKTSDFESAPTNLKVVDEKESNKPITTVFHKVEEYLSDNYDLRFNEIALDIEIKPKGDKWQSCNDNSIWVELQKEGIKIGHSALKALLKSSYVKRYNPIKDYFHSLPKWDEEIDYISQYASFINLSESESKEDFIYHFKKWCVRAVKCAIQDGYFNKQAFVLTDDGKGQNIGKSTWCRNLCPKKLSRYIAEDISNNDKDTRILICKNFLINMDELAALSKKEINQLKSLFSKDQINDRLPYDSKNSIIPRVASFIGSTNMSTFLHDETGSVRWLCFVIEDIDWSYKSDFDIDKLWSQAFALSDNTSFVAELTRDDIVKNELRNDKFQFLTSERESLLKFIENSSPNNGDFRTATEITTYLNSHTGLKLNKINIGKALKACNYVRVKLKDQYGYYVRYKNIY